MMCVKERCEEFMRVFLVVSMSPSCIFSKFTWRCHVFINVRRFYQGCDKICLRADDIRIYK